MALPVSVNLMKLKTVKILVYIFEFLVFPILVGIIIYVVLKFL
jgi:hypothetical protein